MTVSVRVELASQSYDIFIGAGLLAQAGTVLGPVLKAPRVVVITDRAVESLYLPILTDSLTAAGIEVLPPISVTPGEQTKSLAGFEELIEAILDRAVARNVTIVALGGGVVGDLAGFAAATVLRGVDFIQIPTTLLAQVDSSVGGKTGINSRHGKNLIGAFYQPRRVLIDPALLATLPQRQRLAGYAEVIKYGLIDTPAFFDWCEAHAAAMLAGDEALLTEAIAESCRAKARVVASDEREAGPRALLNLGHTFAHALEVTAAYDSGLLHGEAVGVGMVLALRLSAQMGLCAPEVAMRVGRHFTRVGLPARIADTPLRSTTPEALIAPMYKDKKARNGQLTFVLARGIGRAFVQHDVPEEEVRTLLAAPEPDFS